METEIDMDILLEYLRANNLDFYFSVGGDTEVEKITIDDKTKLDMRMSSSPDWFNLIEGHKCAVFGSMFGVAENMITFYYFPIDGYMEFAENYDSTPKDPEWKLIGHSYQIADTGDYDGYYELTNGKVSILTQYDDEEALRPIIDALNNSGCKFYVDDSEVACLKAEVNYYSHQNKMLNAVKDEVIKVWNEDGEAGEIQKCTPIAWHRVLRKAEECDQI